MNYADRGGDYLIGVKGEPRNAYGNITAPLNGFLWDAAVRAGVSVRSYGEFAVEKGGGQKEQDGKIAGPYEGAGGALVGRVAPDYPPYDLKVPDAKRVDAWLAEFRRFEQNGELPRLSIFHLPDDHTAGTRPGYPTPRAMIAENDQALGRMVEAISKSRFWKESAIFVVEDDSQSGPDHVDAHRTVALVLSPYTRRAIVDSTLYSTASMLRTIELILGLPPMSQYDAAAAPMYGAFQTSPNLAPFTRREPRVALDEMNGATAWGAAASVAMNLEEPDRAPDLELNEILWKSVRGAASPMPPPVHAAWVRPVGEGEEADGD